MSSTSTSSPSPLRDASTPRFSESSTTSASSTLCTLPSTPPKPQQLVKFMVDTSPPPDPLREERIKASRRRMKRYVFDHSPRVDWRSIPTFDEAEDDTFDYASLSRRPDMWCEVSRKYRDQVIKKYREPLVVDFKLDGSRLLDNGKEVVDMIG